MRKVLLITAALMLWISHASLAATTSSKSKTSAKPTKTVSVARKANVGKTPPMTKKVNHTSVAKKNAVTHQTSHSKKVSKTSKKHVHAATSPTYMSQSSHTDSMVSDSVEEHDNQDNFNAADSKIKRQLSSAQTMSPTSDESASQNTTATHHFLWFGWSGSNTNDEAANVVDASSNSKQVTNLAHQTVANMRYTSYRFGGTRFDQQHGIYMLDCSGYVDNLLNKSSPQAYSTLAQWTGTYKPNSAQYYDFFNFLANRGSFANWDKVDNPQKLQPGDILVFRYKNSRGKTNGGHVMLVMGKAVVKPDVVQVKVADSAATGHSADTRGKRSGIGIGTLLLKVNPQTGRPYAFAWRLDSPWNSRVNIMMGRPGGDA